MTRRPPRSTRTDTLFPDTTLFRSLKNAIAGCFGVLISTVGIDFTTGAERFTFGIPELTEGISFGPLMIGLFAGSELLYQVLNPDRNRKRSEEHTSELQSLMRISYAVFCLKKKNKPQLIQI